MIARLAVIGVGLIGGSLARAVRLAGAVNRIVGCGRSAANLERAIELGVIDHSTQDPAQAVRDADLVFIAVPLGAMRDIFAAIKGRLRDDAVITDGGSVKGSVVADARAIFGDVPARLVPGHPIAGTERSGVEASFPTLYRDQRVILTPLPATDPEALNRVTRMWHSCGAQVTNMDVAHHDRILAATSHLPHMLAFGLVDALADSDGKVRHFGAELPQQLSQLFPVGEADVPPHDRVARCDAGNIPKASRCVAEELDVLPPSLSAKATVINCSNASNVPNRRETAMWTASRPEDRMDRSR